MKTFKQFILENSMCTPKQAHKAFDEYFDNFDINEIPLDVRKKAIKDYEEIANDAKLVSEEFWIDVEENLKDDIASTKEVVKMLKEKYGMTDYQFKAINPYKVQIVSVSKIPNYLATTNSVLLPLVNKNVNIIKEEFDKIGYYLVRESAYYDKSTDCKWVLLMFDPKNQEDISKQIRNRCNVLYHFSPIENHQSIVENGIVPRNDKRVFTFNEKRVYLITVNPSHPDFIDMMSNTYSNRKRTNKMISDKFMIYMIKVSKLSKDIKLFYDPHGRNCVFTTSTIPYSCIIDEEEKEICKT